MMLHSSAELVLGLPWLNKYNPTTNWRDFTFSFKNGIPLMATWAENSSQYHRSKLLQHVVSVEEVAEEESKLPTLPLTGPALIPEKEYQQHLKGRNWVDFEETNISILAAQHFYNLIKEGCELFLIYIQPF